MAVSSSKRSLIYPWSPIAVLLVVLLDKNQEPLLVFVPTFLASCAEMLIAGYSSLRVMFFKLTYAMITALIVGFLLGMHLMQQSVPRYASDLLSSMAWCSLCMLLLVNWISLHTLLKAVKREYGNPEDD
jgi:hypothetical protein